jgi:hypothetical protein
MTHNLGRVQIAILRALRDEEIERSILIPELRKSLYNDDVPISIQLRRIRQAIKTLKRKGIIIEEVGILSRTK